jgi:site-specific DNA-methyltransferase (adenine-specific)
MFSFAGDTVLDPFSGTCATAVAAHRAGRHSISNELDPFYYQIGLENIRAALADRPLFGATNGQIIEDRPVRMSKSATTR